MSSRAEDRRRAPRVTCRLPVRLRVGSRSVHATTVDMSRIGVRLAIPLEEIGLGSDHSLADIGRQVTESLGDVVMAAFHYELLGTLVSKGLRLVRVGRADMSGDTVDVGCTLRTPLTDEEVGFLGLDLPAGGHFVGDQPNESYDDRERGTSAIVCAGTDRQATPFCASYQELEEGMCLTIERKRLPVLPESHDAGTWLGALIDAYGQEVFVVLLRGMRPFWSGPAVLQAVDLLDDGAVAAHLVPKSVDALVANPAGGA